MAIMIASIVLTAAGLHAAPHLTRRDIFFGVTVAPDVRDRPEGRAIARRYAAEIWLLAFAGIALVATSPMPFVSASMLFGQSVGAWVAFGNARRAARRYAVSPPSIRESEIGPRPGLPGGLALQIGPFLILLAAAAYVALNWDAVPARFPTHWNLTGRPDGWTAKSVPGVFGGVAIGLVACSMNLFTAYAVLHWSRLPRVSGSVGRQYRRVQRANLLALLAWEYMLALLLAWTTAVARFADEATLPLPFRIAPFACFLLFSFVIHLLRRAPADGGPIGDTTPDSCWLFGRMYFNRADPVLFVERRVGLGYTLNLGNPLSWLVLIVFVVALSVPLILVA
jgi:uncharacterized membrane protein